MRAVQFTQHFAHQFLEVVVVVDARQESAVSVTVAFPVDAMNVFLVELVLHLLPSMVEDVFPFLGRLVVEDGFETDRLALAVLYGHLLDAATGAEIEVVALLVWNHHGTADVLHHQFRAVFLQVLAPEVRTSFERSLIIQLVTLLAQQSIAQG